MSIEEDLKMEIETEKTTSLNLVKILIIGSMMLTTFLCQVLPFKLLNRVKDNQNHASRSLWRSVLSYCSCFSGGVFIGACLLDLLPEADEKMQEILEELRNQYDVEIDYPVTNLVLCLGFFMILALEQSVLSLQESWLDRRHHELEETQPLLTHNHSHHHHSSSDHQHPALSGVSGEVHHHHDGHGQGHSHATHSLLQHSTLRSLMLLTALSFHSVFEGIAIGLQDNSADLLSIFLAVMIHKALMAFSLGLNMAQSDLSGKSFMVSSIVFSLASPLGVTAGILMSGLPPSLPSDICNGVLQCVAGGTFLYITFFEVLPHELNVPGNRLKKVFFVILGFVAICGVLSIAE